MRLSCLRGFCALVTVILVASVASAATIQEVAAVGFDPSTQDFATYFGHTPSAYWLTWDGQLNGNLFQPGNPTSQFTYGPPGGNPAWLKFETQNGGGGGGGGGGGSGGTAPMQSTFVLGNELGGDWTMDFSVLIYDPGFTGTKMTVELVGSSQNTDYAVKELTDTEVVGGMMLTWHIVGEAGEQVLVRMTSEGDDSYAAGFFMDNEVVQAAAPEPASMALLALGVAGLIARRRR